MNQDPQANSMSKAAPKNCAPPAVPTNQDTDLKPSKQAKDAHRSGSVRKISPLTLIIGGAVVIIGVAVGAQLGTGLAHLFFD